MKSTVVSVLVVLAGALCYVHLQTTLNRLAQNQAQLLASSRAPAAAASELFAQVLQGEVINATHLQLGAEEISSRVRAAAAAAADGVAAGLQSAAAAIDTVAHDRAEQASGVQPPPPPPPPSAAGNLQQVRAASPPPSAPPPAPLHARAPDQPPAPAAPRSLFSPPMPTWERGAGAGGQDEKVTGYSVQVLTFDRPTALRRLLRALDAASYDTTVDLRVWVDGAKGKGGNAARDEVVATARAFKWSHGQYRVVERQENVGLVGQWMGCCGDLNVTSRWAIFEDDLEPSQVWFTWLKRAWEKYGHVPDLAGISLQRQHLVATSGSSNLKVDNGNAPYLYKLPGSWGFSPRPTVWFQFLKWYERQSAVKAYHPSVPGLVTTSWYHSFLRQGKHPNMWTAWYIKYSQDHGLYCLYANLPDSKTLTATWNEKGVHPGPMGSVGKRSHELQPVGVTPALLHMPPALVRLGWNGKASIPPPPPPPPPPPLPWLPPKC
eukprot:Tamp_12166.p1 GENE.Tamp_12166~~Tamp_12166.p1  ORF type:complete len:508 (+),score=90.80 Tamp_12166:54-1526(+)